MKNFTVLQNNPCQLCYSTHVGNTEMWTKKSIKYFERHPVRLQSPILAWQTRYNFNSVPMATTVLCLVINLRNLKKITGRSCIHLHMTRKGNMTDLHTQLYSLSLALQCFLSLYVLLFNTAEALPCSSLQHAPREAVPLTAALLPDTK